MIRTVLLILFSLFITVPAFAQFYSTQYRVPNQEWMEIRSEHFRVIYPARYEQEAIRSLSILEAEYMDIRNLVGGELRNFPFILNPENDRSNGFVAPMNFRSEVELAPIKGKALNPQSGDWLESVLPHELVHAMHFSVNPPSLTRALGIFSPDVRRSVHAAAPLGVLEGIAVEHESHGTIPNSGRGNHPFFTNQFNVLLGSPGEWSMGQLVQVSDYTLPFNRHYVGGYELTNWLLVRYGDETVKEAIRFHYKYPFLGFGVALRNTTGYWPQRLYREFSNDVKERENDRLKGLENETDSAAETISFSASCKRLNRPLWLNDNSILFYGRSCNRPAGFYIHDIEEKSNTLLKEVQISEDYYYSLSPNRSRLLFSRYHPDPFYDNLFRGDIHSLEISSAQSYRITRNLRLFSPEMIGSDLYALQTEAYAQTLTRIDEQSGDIIRNIPGTENSTVIQIASNPLLADHVAIIGRINSVQGVWFEKLSEADTLFNRNPDIVFEGGSIFDLHWHPGGDKMLFVSDHTGTMNVYEFNSSDESIIQITQSLYNSFEASYSHDGERIAYITQHENEQVLKVLDLKQAYRRTLERDSWSAASLISDQLDRPLMNRESDIQIDGLTSEPYKTGLGWLKPRMWLPLYEREAGFDRVGVTIEGVDQMNSRAYSLETTHYMDRLWYELQYSHKGFYPGFQLDLFNRPSLPTFRITQNGDEFLQTFLQQSRGASLKFPVRIRLESNARFSSILLEPQYFISQLRFLDPLNSSTSFSEFGTRHTLGFRTVLSLRLRQFIRDVQPNSGWVFFTETRYGLNSSQLDINTDQFSVEANLTDRKGFRGGVSTYVAPFMKWNQSLQITAQAITQTDLPVFNTASLYSETFTENPFPLANNVGILNTRYTIPLIFPDDGGLLIPAYLSNIYLVLFTQTVSDLNNRNLTESSRSVYGAGIRSRFRLSNLSFDVGISFGWEPTRRNITWHAGSF
jgi:hypothetical protein